MNSLGRFGSERGLLSGLRKYRLTLATDMLGTIPKDKAVYKEFITSRDAERLAREMSEKDAEALILQSIELVPEDKIEEVAEGAEKGAEGVEKKPAPVGRTAFYTDPGGILLLDYQIRGFIKEAGNTLAYQLGIKNLRSKITQFVFVGPRILRIYGDEGKQVVEPDDVNTRPLRVITMQGPRTSIVQSDVVKAGRTVDFEIEILVNPWKITFETLEDILLYGSRQGLLQFRTGGYGRFNCELIKDIRPLLKRPPTVKDEEMPTEEEGVEETKPKRGKK